MKEKGVFKTLSGEITVNLGKGFYRVYLENDRSVIARIGGKMKGRTRRLIVNDRVKVEVSAYDLERGRIVKLL